MPAAAQSLRYQSYLLRYWEEHGRAPSQPAAWRFSLEEVETGKRHGFADLEALVAFLRAEISPDSPEREPDVSRNHDSKS
jgi:hypothetical protein